MSVPAALIEGLLTGATIPYLGPGVLTHGEAPRTSGVLAGALSAAVSVPHKARKVASAAAQYIENFKHRSTLNALVTAAFAGRASPSRLHHLIAGLPAASLIVHAWYDDAMVQALEAEQPGEAFALAQSVSPAEHRLGTWFAHYATDGAPLAPEEAATRTTLLYAPLGCVRPARNYLISDADFVETLTEIDIQTPIPPEVIRRRTGRGFAFIGCRFDDQIARTFARQIMKRSGGPHWAFLPEELTRGEARFLAEQEIVRIAAPPAALEQALEAALSPA
jgi:hypothetical protein